MGEERFFCHLLPATEASQMAGGSKPLPTDLMVFGSGSALAEKQSGKGQVKSSGLSSSPKEDPEFSCCHPEILTL